MIAGLSDEELTTAGQLLSRLDPAEVLREHPDTPVLTVAITGYGQSEDVKSAMDAGINCHLVKPVNRAALNAVLAAASAE